MRADDDPQGIFCVNSGLVRQYTISLTGIELTLTILKPPTYFPMIWAMNSAKNIYNFEALTDVEVTRAPREVLMEFIKDKPEVMLALMQELLAEYAESLVRIEHLVFSDAYRRVISVLLYLAKHFGETQGKGVIVHHWFTQQDIATLVGVARETASNELSKLEKNGLIGYEGHALILIDLELMQKRLLHTDLLSYMR